MSNVRVWSRCDDSTGGLENLVVDVLDLDGEVLRTTQLGVEAGADELQAMHDDAVAWCAGILETDVASVTVEGGDLLTGAIAASTQRAVEAAAAAVEVDPLL